MDLVEAKESIRICREEIQHEQGVLGSRLASYITAQAFLVSGYAVSMGNMSPAWGATFKLVFPTALSAVGLILSIQAYPGIAGSSEIISRWHARQHDIFNANAEVRELYVQHEEAIQASYRRSLWFAHTSPWTFGALWILLGAVTIWMHALGETASGRLG